VDGMAKKKGDKGGNPAPVQNEKFLAKRFQPATDLPEGSKLATKPLSVKVEADIDAWIRSLPQPSVWLRRAITDAALAEMRHEADVPRRDRP
jgi:hypothetical protein